MTIKEEYLSILKEISTEALAAELCSRKDILDSEGIMPLEVYRLIEHVQPISCVDGVAVRRNTKGEMEAMAIRRGTRRYKGTLCSVGGRIRYKESVEDCLRRQFRTDIGREIKILIDWSRPVTVMQSTPVKENENPPKDFGPEEERHCVSGYYPVQLVGETIKLGATSFGGQEALAVEWYALPNLPPEKEFAYGQRSKFVACMKAAEILI